MLRAVTAMCGSEAEDVVQVALLKFVHGLPAYRGADAGGLPSFAVTIAKRVAISRNRVAPPDHDPLNDALEPTSEEPDAEARLIVEWERRNLREAVRVLDREHPRSAAALTMRMDGKSENEIAEAFGLTRGATKILLHRARAAVREILDVVG